MAALRPLLSILVTLGLFYSGFGAPIAEDVGPLIPESKRRDTTLETLELEQSLKRLSGENKKFFPNPFKRPIMQIDGLDEEQTKNGIEEDEKVKAEEIGESNTAGGQKETEEKELEEEAEVEKPKNEDDEASSEEAVQSEAKSQEDEEEEEENGHTGGKDDDEDDDEKDEEEERGDLEEELKQDIEKLMKDEELEERLKEAEEEEEKEEELSPADKRASPYTVPEDSEEPELMISRKEEDEFLRAMFDLLENHPDLARLLLQAEEEDERNARPYNDYPTKLERMNDNYMRQAQMGGNMDWQGQREYGAGNRALRRMQANREYYQGVSGDADGHVVAKKMMEEPYQ